MEEVAVSEESVGETGVKQRCAAPPKWAALVDDVVVPMPRPVVTAGLVKSEASVPPDYVLVRDHNSPNDVVFQGGDAIDLRQGNVFYRLKACDVQPRGHCDEQPKLALIVDDRAEVTIRQEHTGKAIHELFAIPQSSRLVRDTEGPNDEVIGLEQTARFVDGPVFYTREVHSTLSITVNSQVFTEHGGVTHSMTGLQIAILVYRDNASETRVWFVSDGNREISLTEKIHIRGCEVFEVVRKEVTGGFELSRVRREVQQLRAGGAKVSLISKPAPAVVYHGLQCRRGNVVSETDVLVPVPGGYPGQLIDWAYLPEGSPLIGRVKGSPQGDRFKALERMWQQISYHPHNGGGGQAWNPTHHGFHTYLGELLSWLCNLN